MYRNCSRNVLHKIWSVSTRHCIVTTDEMNRNNCQPSCFPESLVAGSRRMDGAGGRISVGRWGQRQRCTCTAYSSSVASRLWLMGRRKNERRLNGILIITNKRLFFREPYSDRQTSHSPERKPFVGIYRYFSFTTFRWINRNRIRTVLWSRTLKSHRKVQIVCLFKRIVVLVWDWRLSRRWIRVCCGLWRRLVL